ncbi:hypothetical protein K493DRAFT_15015 [Basidiobolus meristosporus CBS 931.73]|uniref:Man1/Src1-like C-terminal domain-containing protein n=1 Tax=Basidiobolus meristosporus CBS 931.73 TaxID=1314790 RepID=A0A1Y1YH61_9FUNG|nr:hypothetical protein K493DRAFT_15015 [Basidiobolus meristosporus CBS 931.73]|eukprot:ORX97337.1 hypothetical protein K493DRAFT_15015 [Basidiobolus meristosporus CBS 931.73]
MTPNKQSSSTSPPKSRVKQTIEMFELLSSDGETSPPPKRKPHVRRKITKPIIQQNTDSISSEGESSPPPVPRVQTRINQGPKEIASTLSLQNELGGNLPEKEPAHTDLNASAEDTIFSDENVFQSGGETPKRIVKKYRRKPKIPTHTYSKEVLTAVSPPEVSIETQHQVVPSQYTDSFVDNNSILDEAEMYLASKYRHRRRKHHRQVYIEYQWGSFWVFLSICFMAFLLYLRIQHQRLGYCLPSDVDSATPMSLLFPRCTPCPIHGECQHKEFLGCEPSYLPKYTPLISFVNPLRVKCVPDSTRMAKVEAIVEMAQEILKSRAGMIQCQNQPSTHTGLAESELQQALMAKPMLQHLNLVDLWPSVVQGLTNRNDVSSDSSGELVFSSNEPEYSLGCQGIHAYIQPVLISAGLMVLGIYCTLQYNAYLAEKQMVHQLVRQVYRMLRVSANEVSVVQLRDYLVFDIPPKKRLLLWTKASQIVAQNPNVRTTRRKVNGDVSTFWKWVGKHNFVN